MPLEPIEIRTLHDGLNLKDDPSDPSFKEGATVECVGFDLTIGGKLQTAKGNSTDLGELAGLLPFDTVQCAQVVSMLGTEYVLATTAAGLYSNATLIDTTFTGRFKALTFGGNIYLINGTLARRFDGTTCTRWGIAPPTAGPTITAGDNVVKVIDDMEDVTDYIANASGLVASSEAVIVKVGTASLQLTMAAAGTGYTYRAMTKNAAILSDSSASPDEDLLEFWFYVDDLTNLTSLRLVADVGDGTFENDFYEYIWSFYGGSSQQITPGSGGSAEVTPEQSIEIPIQMDPSGQVIEPTKSWVGGDKTGHWVYTYDPATDPSTQTGKIIISRASIEELFPELKTFTSQTLPLYRLSNITSVKSGVWTKLQVPKSYFTRTGTGTGTWADDVSWKIEVVSFGAVNVYIDQIQIAGGGKLYGDYWFMYGWARTDTDGNVQHYSGPARAVDGTLHIQGPINFKRQPVAYAARIVSTDPQVNACVVYVIGGNLTNWYVLQVIGDNAATSGNFSAGEDDCYRSMISLRNDPAPAGLDMVLHKGAIWMVGFSNYPNMIRKSDISIEGDLMLEAWPGRNAYIPTGAGSQLTSIDILNRQVVVRGIDGEWVLDINDPGDFSSVVQDEVVGKGCLSRDGVMKTGNSVIYPAAGAFVESNGSNRNLVLPEASPAISAGGVLTAVAVFNNYEGYFSFTDPNGQNRTAKLDVMRGNPRVAFHNNLKYDWLFLHNRTGVIYGIINGTVVQFNSGYANINAELDCRLTSRVFQIAGGKSSWRRITFEHLTNGRWLHIEAYVDGVLIKHEPFKSTIRTEHRFDFGPVSGNKFQLVIWGQYNQLAEIYLPIRVY